MKTVYLLSVFSCDEYRPQLTREDHHFLQNSLQEFLDELQLNTPPSQQLLPHMAHLVIQPHQNRMKRSRRHAAFCVFVYYVAF
jgi:hypothetical protein